MSEWGQFSKQDLDNWIERDDGPLDDDNWERTGGAEEGAEPLCYVCYRSRGIDVPQVWDKATLEWTCPHGEFEKPEPKSWTDQHKEDRLDKDLTIESLREMLTRSAAGMQLVLHERNQYKAALEEIRDTSYNSRAEVREVARVALKPKRRHE
jgi:hypothetical protein